MDFQEFRARLEQALQSLPLCDKAGINVLETDPFRYLLDIVSADFEGMEEWKRQHLVRNHLYKSFSLTEVGENIEFIATDAPSEREVVQ